MLYEIVPQSAKRDSACLQAFLPRIGAERTRTAVTRVGSNHIVTRPEAA